MEENQFLHVKQETWDRINEKMPPEEELQDLADFFKIFGDATGLRF